MPEPTPNKTVPKVNEEQIVNRIVELLNDKGYEYERDARPIICWKFGVQSSRELSLNQKKEVKESLENGVFEKWGMEYKEKVLDKQMDIVKEIEKLHGAPTDIKIDPKRNVAVAADNNQAKPGVKDQEKVDSKSDVEILKNKNDKPAKKADKQLIDASNLKIDIPVKKAESDKVKNDKPKVESKSKTSKIDLKNSKISLKKTSGKPTESLDKPVEKVENKKQTAKLKTLSSGKEDTKVVEKYLKTEDKKEATVEQPISTDVPKQEKPTAVEKVITESKDEKVPEQDTAVEDQTVQQTVPVPKGKRYRLTSRGSSENNLAMGLEEAEKIVKNKFSEQSSHEEMSTASVALVFMSLSLLTFSIYTNYLVFMDINFPSWLVFICEMFR